MNFRKWFSPLAGNTSYLPHIDGLRAIAVMLVVLFHAFPNHLPGGFIGVDIFFVISGYLISGIIIKEINAGKFTVLGFYQKRINRIFPALIFVLLVCIFFSKKLMFKSEIEEFNLSIIFSTTFLANIFFLNTLNYFDNTAEDHPLLHFWSLGVEEQFYIFWPLLLIFVAKKNSIMTLRIMISILIISFLLNILLVTKNQSHVFYSPITRIWELGFGSLCAYYQLNNKEGILKQKFTFKYDSDLLTLLGLLLIIYCESIITSSSVFPGWIAVLPVLGAGLILMYGAKSVFVGKLLSFPLLVFIGLISYPLYLWHWPLLSFSHIYQGYLITSNLKLGLVIASILLAIITYYLIEVPLRFKLKHQLKPAFLLVGLFGIGVYSLLNYYQLKNTTPTEMDKLVSFYKNYVDTTEFVKNNRVDCGYINTNGTVRDSLPKDCAEKNSQGNSIFLWGDSHAYQFYYGLNKSIAGKYNLSQVASSGCDPFDPDNHKLKPAIKCIIANKKALEIIRSTRPRVVLLAQKDGHLNTDWDALANLLISIGVQKIILLGPVPQWNEYLYRYLAKKYEAIKDFPEYLDGDLLNKRLLYSDDILKQRLSTGKIQYISLIDMLCINHTSCLTYYLSDNGEKELTSFDYGHLTLGTSQRIGKDLVKIVSESHD